MRNICAVLSFCVIAGCASMSTEECLTADWQAIGYEDGARGAPVSAVTHRRQACAKKAGVTVDMAAYMAGRDSGLVEFCQPPNGYALGARGGAYNGVCTGPGEHDFASAYQAGRQLYTLQHEVNAIAGSISKAHYDLDKIDKDIAYAEAALIAPETPHPERILILKDIKRLSEDRGNIETAIVALNRDHVRAEEELADYHAFIAVNGPYPRGASMPTQAGY